MRSSEELGTEDTPTNEGTRFGDSRTLPSARQDLIGGVLAIAFGVFVLDRALGYPMGSPLRMGPGLFPTVLSGSIVILGAALALHGLRRRPTTAAAFQLRPVIMIATAIVLFALLIERHGIVPASMSLVLVSALGAPRFHPWRSLLVAAATTGAIYLIFIVILQMPFTVARW